MSTINYTYQSDLILGFKAIPHKAYSRKVYYIHQNLDMIRQLDDQLRVEMLVDYIQALYELGEYGKCSDVIDDVILDVMDSNYHSSENDAFVELLKLKCNALYLTGKFSEAQHVASEILKIDPKMSSILKCYRKSMWRQYKSSTDGLRALIIMLMLFGLGITCFDLLIVQNFLPDKAMSVNILKYVFFYGAGIMLIIIELTIRYMSYKKSKSFIKHCLAKKSSHSRG